MRSLRDHIKLGVVGWGGGMVLLGVIFDFQHTGSVSGDLVINIVLPAVSFGIGGALFGLCMYAVQRRIYGDEQKSD